MSTMRKVLYRSERWLLYVMLIALAGCGKTEGKADYPAPEVCVAEVAQKTIPIYDFFTGNVAPVRVVKIIPRVSGYIDKIYFEDGSIADAGAQLYLIDPRPFKAAVDAAAAQLNDDIQKLKFAEIEATRYTTLYKEQATTQEKMQDTVSIRDQLRAAVEKDKADLADAKLNLSYTAINSTFPGFVQKTNFYEGALVSKQASVLTTVIQVDPMYINFDVSRAQQYKMQQLKPKMELLPVDKMTLEVYLPDGSVYPPKGKIDYMSFIVDESTDCLQARGIIKNTRQEKNTYVLIPGQYVRIKINYGKYPDALLIPQAALVESQLGTHVYVVGKNDIVGLREVKTGEVHGSDIQITDGLSAGETVVVQGVQKVKSGIAVKIISGKAK